MARQLQLGVQYRKVNKNQQLVSDSAGDLQYQKGDQHVSTKALGDNSPRIAVSRMR